MSRALPGSARPIAHSLPMDSLSTWSDISNDQASDQRRLAY